MKIPIGLGLPGIDKTTLLKQIAYLWAKGQLLNRSRFLFLLHHRDPSVHEITTLKKLLHLFYDTDVSVRSCLTQLQDNEKSVVFLLDDYDEYPVELRQNSFISDIIDRKKFCSSAIVISSRPHASTNLRSNVLFQVEILSFSEDD